MKCIEEAVILSAVRSPISSFRGSFASLSAPQLGARVIKEAILRAGINNDAVQEVYMGIVFQAGVGQAPARQATLLAGLPVNIPCSTINKACASSAKAIILASQALMLGCQEVIVAGGMESMSNVPYYLLRKNLSFGDIQLKDGLNYDGLEDAYGNGLMGYCAEGIAKKYNFSREDQDAYAISSYKRTASAVQSNKFRDEIVPVVLSGKKGKPDIIIDEDEEYKKVNFEKIPFLPPVFKKDGGTITAANAPSLGDGAAVCVLSTKTYAEKNNLQPCAKILGFSDAAVEPQNYAIAPAYAIRKILQKFSLDVEDIDLWEINEAFSVVALVNIKLLNLNPEKVNIHGGAVSLSHPVGMTGARIVIHLVHSLKPGEKGIAAICNGGGGASAILIEKL